MVDELCCQDSRLLMNGSFLRQGVRIVQKVSSPTLMIGAAAGGDVRVDAASEQTVEVILREIIGVQVSCFWLTQFWWHSIDGGQGRLLVVGMATQPVANN